MPAGTNTCCSTRVEKGAPPAAAIGRDAREYRTGLQENELPGVEVAVWESRCRSVCTVGWQRISGKDRWLLTERGAELRPFAVIRHRAIEVEHFPLEEPEGNDSEEWFRDRNDVVGRLGGRWDTAFTICVAQSQRENDLPVFDNGD